MTCAEKYVCPYCGTVGCQNIGEIFEQDFYPRDNFVHEYVMCEACGGTYDISFEVNPESVQIKPVQPGEEED